MRRFRLSVSLLPVVILIALAYAIPSARATNTPYTKVTIQTNQGSWGNNLGDLNGDGFLDIVEGGGDLGGNVYWYQYPSWQRFQIGDDGGGDDLQIGDVNADGAPDVVVNGSGKIVWYQNPRGTGGNVQGSWVKHTVDSTTQSHDIVLTDLNADGRMDIVIRVELGSTYYYLQGDNADAWTRVLIPEAPDGHGGLVVADINRDGHLDIVENGFWLQGPADYATGTWIRRDVVSWDVGASAAVCDINHDGRLDIVLAASETGPGMLSWFEAPADPIGGTWIRHDIDSVEDVHRFALIDVDKDGTEDLVFAEMHTSSAQRVGIYHNNGLGASWALQVLATTGSHNIAVGDIGNDGDVDIVGANWSTNSPDGGAQNLWRCDLNDATTLDAWSYVQVDGAKTDVAFGLTFGDLDNDGRTDIISGEYWYRNPGGDMSGAWARSQFGSYDAMLVMDVDGNGQLDVIAQSPSGGSIGIYWLQPLDASASSWNSVLVGTIPGSRDGNSQGYAVAQLTVGGRPQIIFSSDSGFYAFTIPANPAAGSWPSVQLNTDGTQEGIAAADINGDGRIDLAGSSHTSPGAQGQEVDWWQNPGTGAGNWTKIVAGTTTYEADRVEIADLNNDGRPDIIATDSDYSGGRGNLSWFEQQTDGTWVKHAVVTNVGSLASMDVGDFNKDGLVDIVIGEHQNSVGPLLVTVFQNVGGGAAWIPHVVSSGRESHEGTQAVDLDRDGDLDIVSIAFNTSQFVHLWRNDATAGSGLPDVTPPSVAITNPANAATVSGTITLTVTAGDDVGVTGVQYRVDGGVLGSEVTTNPFSSTWDTTTFLNGVHTLTATARDAAGNSTTSAPIAVTIFNAGPAPGPITFRQSASATDDGSSPSIQATFPADTTVGNLIVVAASWGTGGTLTCSDSRGNTYATVAAQFDSANNQALGVCYAANITGGTVTVTAQFAAGAASYRRILIHEYSGVATVNPVDGTVGRIATASTAPDNITSGSVSTTVAGALLFGVVMDDEGTNISQEGSNFTMRDSLNGRDLASEDRVATTAGSVAATWTFSASHRYLARLVAFRPALAGLVDTTPPLTSMSAPAAGSTVSGNVTLMATASDDVGIAGVRFMLDGAPLGAETTSAPYTITWDTTTTANGSTSLTALARDAAGNTTTSAAVTVTVNNADTTPPVISSISTSTITATTATIVWATNEPADSQVDFGTLTTYGSSTPVDATLTTSHSVLLSALSSSTTYHYRVRSTDGAGNASASTDRTFTTSAPPDTTPPAVAISAPTGGATVSGTINLTVNTSDNVGVAGVRYFVDGAAIGAEVTASPFSYTWSTASVSNGSHTLTATARDAAGNSTTSAAIAVTVSNAGPAPGAITFLQSSSATNDGSSSSIQATFPTATTAGDLIVVAASWGTGGTLTCSDSRGNTYATVAAQFDSTNNQALGVCYAANITGGTVTVTAQFTAGSAGYRRILIHEYSGVDTVNPVDGTVGRIATASTASDNVTSGSISTTVAGALLFGAAMDDDGTNSSQAGSGFAMRASLNGRDLASEDRVATTAGSMAATWTFSTAHRYLALLVAFKPAAAGSTDTTPPVISSISATNITTTTATMVWATNEPADSQVDFGTLTTYGSSTPVDATSTTSHSVPLSGLSPSTTYHYRVRSKDGAGNVSQSTDRTVTTSASPDTTPPTVAISAPAGGATVSGTINLTVNTSDNVGVAGVQYFADGAAIGAEITTSPFSSTWNTTTVSNSTHTLTARARDAAGNSTTGAPISVNVSNGAPAPGPITFRQSATATNDASSSTIQATFPAATTAGNLIVVAASWGTGGTLTCSDSRGNTYTTVAAQYDGTNNQALGVCYAANITGGAVTVTAQFTAGPAGYRRILIHEYSGVDTVNPVDGTVGRIATASTASDNVTSGSISTTVAGALLFGAAMDDDGTNSSQAGSGFTMRASVNGRDLASEDRVATTAGSVAATWTFSASHRYLARLVVFRPAGQ